MRQTPASPPPHLTPEVASAMHDAEAAARVLRRFRIVFNAVKTHFQQVEKLAGIGGAQLWALSVIQGRPDVGVGALAEAMDVHQTTASNLVRTLSSLGLVSAQRGERDRRAVCLRLTPAGELVLQAAPGPFNGVLPQALAALDPVTLARLEQDLGQLIGLLQADEQGGRVPLAHM